MDNAARRLGPSCGQWELGDGNPAVSPKNRGMTQAPTKVTSLTDLVELVPSLLGFHASDSVVLLAIQDGTVALTARTDLAGSPGLALAAAWRRLPDALFIVVAFSPHSRPAWSGLDEVDLALPETAERILVHADGERWFQHPEDEGTPYDAVGSAHLAAAAYAGRPVRRTREELIRLVEPRRSPAEVTASLERVAAREDTLSDVVAAALALVEGHDEAPGELDIDEATVLCLASHEPRFLDGVLMSTTVENAASRLALWLQVVGSSVPNCAGGALTAAALAAWLTGNGALQSVCLEAVDGRPGPALWVDVLGAVNRDALPPTEWASLRASLATVGVSTMPT